VSAGLVVFAVGVATIGLLMTFMLRVKLGSEPKTAWRPSGQPLPPPLPRSFFVLRKVGWGYAVALLSIPIGRSLLSESAADQLLLALLAIFFATLVARIVIAFSYGVRERRRRHVQGAGE